MDAFLAALPEAARARLATEPELDAWLSRAIEEAREAWPGLVFEELDLARYLATKVSALPEHAFRQLRVTDLSLCYACLRGSEHAFVLFEERYVPVIERALDRMRMPRQEIEDLRGALREALFFGKEGARPLLEDYAGRGDLANWLRSIALRAALKVRRREEKIVEAEGTLEMLPADGNPELEYLRTRHAREFKEALVVAVGALSIRERNLLRQHYIDRLTLDALARLYVIHRATVARWLADARESVLSGVKQGLRSKGVLTDSEIESVVRMARSGFDISISLLLRA